MYKNLLGWLTAVLILPSCSNNSPNISVICEENTVGNCIIKWETTPTIEGKVKIYASTDPENIPEKNPIAITDISDQRTVIITSDPTERYYYKMVFNNRYKVVTASRNSIIAGIQNFRDIGGYSSDKGKTVKWGMLYRSAEIEEFSYSTRKELKNMGIKTIINLRTDTETAESPKLSGKGFQVVDIPIGIPNTNEIIHNLREGRIKNDSIYRLMLRMNREMVTYYRSEYKKMFDILLVEDNYPVIILCTSGKGRTAIASALILSALNVSDDIIMSDYRLSNDYFDIPKVSSFGYNLPVNSQEALTTLFSARESFLNAAKSQIEKNYGNIPTYLERGLGLSKDDIKHLRNILLE